MSAVIALRVPLDEDLSGFVALLRRAGVPHRVAEQGGELALWVPDEALAEQVRELHGRYRQGAVAEPEAVAPVTAKQPPSRFWPQLKASPATASVLLLTFVVFLVTLGGDNFDTMRWISFVDFQVQGERLYLNYLDATLASGQWWRLITPMLIHFGWLHLAMNSLWYWELGRRIEFRQGRLGILGLTLLFGLASNIAQYAWVGPSLFGGLSGVLYGLLGHCWLYQWLAPNPAYRLPRGVLVSMLIWLLVCMTGVFELLQVGAIANAAHVGGLFAGCLTGLLGGVLARRSARG